jgi:ATP-dependent exoDNAse (exonuclease V) alpha subunit
MEEKIVTYNLKELKKATGKKKPKWEIEGTVTYMPLRLAYGTTVHKSQGLTMDRVQVLITDDFFSAPGMLYVALSRARSLEGLRIVGTERMFVGRCGVDEKVRRWL